MATKRFASLALGAALLGWPSGAVAVPLAAQVATSPAEEAAEQEAVTFRQTFGFASSIDLVRAARRDTVNYSEDPYGVPLSTAEIAEMKRRAKIQSAMGTAVEEARKFDTFAGAYIDQHERGRPVFMFTAVDSRAQSALSALLPKDADLQLATAERTEIQIEALRDRIIRDWDGLERDGVEVVRIAVKTEANSIVIGVHGKTAADETVLKAKYGSFVEVIEANAAHTDVCNIDNCRPMKGGLAIRELGSPVVDCTSGWVVKRTDTATYAILTAGHCIHLNGGNGRPWMHNNDQFGNAINETWVPGGEGDGDVGLITLLSNEDDGPKNHMRRNSTSIASVTNWAVAMTGMQACRIGATSGHGSCGTITHPDITHWSEAPGGSPRMRVFHTIEYSFDSQGGDSGGPVFFYPSGSECCSPVTMFGTHVHSWDTGDPLPKRSWATPYLRGRSAYAALTPSAWTYNMCFTAAC